MPTKADCALIAFFLLTAAALAFAPVLRRGAAAAAVVISVDGDALETLPLGTDALREVNGHNTVEILGGGVRMTRADCPDGLCVSQGVIREPGELIVCLPNRVVIEIRGGSTGDTIDEMTR